MFLNVNDPDFILVTVHKASSDTVLGAAIAAKFISQPTFRCRMKSGIEARIINVRYVDVN